ncbi:DUF5131 family protein [Miltoncostaea oceani]|uniref:DUF5131 family protein n=1 Tax=Miltoncostaea oceani TaxID=2843216 RepID=UPI001C3C578A|nr:phage Gp37/Gp68 family protein [Miltoncostaea oceani]
MGADSAIQWTHHTFNPWRGCTHVSPGCEHCYAEALSKRNPAQLGTWGAGGTRVIASESYWRQPERWNRAAEKAGERHRVFCASLADVFEDRPELDEPRVRLLDLIIATPHLDWLLLTKRPENARTILREVERGARWVGSTFAEAFPNVWLGTTVEDQRRADERIPILLDTPAAVRFLSCEPLLGPVDLVEPVRRHRNGPLPFRTAGIDWIIVGGESGPKARPMDLAWARSLVEQGQRAAVPVFVKQLGRRPVYAVDHRGGDGMDVRVTGATSLYAVPGIAHSHGGDIDEWPADLQVREFPTAAVTVP